METKGLVTYFSCGGTTELAAKKIANFLGCDLCEIQAQEAYSKDDLNWRNQDARSTREMQDESARPTYKPLAKDLADYDLIFVGYPIWWDIEPRIIDTFIEKEGLRGNTLVPFVTSGGSPITKAQARLEEKYGENIDILPGHRMTRNPDEEEIRAWVDQLNI